MIKLYYYPDYETEITSIPVESGQLSEQISGSYSLSFSVRKKLLSSLNIDFSRLPFFIFQYKSNYFRQTSWSSSDADFYTWNVSAEDDFSHALLEKYYKKYDYTGNFRQHVENIFSGTNYTLQSLETTNSRHLIADNVTGLAAFNQVCGAFGFEFIKDGFTVICSPRFRFGSERTLTKGKSILSFNENVDSTNVTTELRYGEKDGLINKVLQSNFYSKYPVKLTIMEFDPEEGNVDTQASKWLEQNGQPKVDISCTVHKSFPEIPLGAGVEILNARGEFSLETLPEYAPNVFPLRVLAKNVDITRQSAYTYKVGNYLKTIGEAMKNFIGDTSKYEGGGGERIITDAPTVANFDYNFGFIVKARLAIFAYDAFNIDAQTYMSADFPTVSNNLDENITYIFPNVNSRYYSDVFAIDSVNFTEYIPSVNQIMGGISIEIDSF